MEYSVSKQGNNYIIHISENFTFNDNQKFRDILATVRSNAPDTVTVEMQGLSFVDSAALGMLLLLNDEAKSNNISVTLSGAQGQVRKMLELSNFDKLFTVHYS